MTQSMYVLYFILSYFESFEAKSKERRTEVVKAKNVLPIAEFCKYELEVMVVVLTL